MYVTRPLSLYRRSPEILSLPPPEGPNSGYLVLFDEESETTSCFGLFKNKTIKHPPFPQNKDLTVWYATIIGGLTVTYLDDVLFIPVLNQTLSSNRYYVIRRQGKHKGRACTNSKEEDKGTSCCCCLSIQDVKPRPLDPSDAYQQFEIIDKKHSGFSAKSVAPDGNPPEFLRRKNWQLKMHEPRNYGLSEAQGLNSSLRASLPDFNFSLSNEISKPVVVGKWYCPFMFVKEDIAPKYQMKISTFYEMTLEQRWERFFACDNVESDQKMVPIIDVVVEREEAFVAGRKAVWEERKLENGVIWFRSRDSKEGKEVRVGLSTKIVERMKWEQERVGWVCGDQKQVRIERREEFGGINTWNKFGCYVLVERFVLKRKDGIIVLEHDFRHIHHLRGKWE